MHKVTVTSGKELRGEKLRASSTRLSLSEIDLIKVGKAMHSAGCVGAKVLGFGGYGFVYETNFKGKRIAAKCSLKANSSSAAKADNHLFRECEVRYEAEEAIRRHQCMANLVFVFDG